VPDLPEQIRFAQVKAFLAELGIDVEQTLHVHFNEDNVEVKQVRMRDGVAFSAGKELSTVTTVIGYLREDDADGQ
jgi:hypothetical protein